MKPIPAKAWASTITKAQRNARKRNSTLSALVRRFVEELAREDAAA
ncbi:MAG TPA: hypothetical protein PLB01_00085 [Thermoanaerobaculia bacterium]|nr:hypothetical protein [Thermoanaerobaculia bacterium]